MPKDIMRPPQKQMAPQPYSDFELIQVKTSSDNKKTVTKGRFLYWGDVKSNDCPA